MLAGILLFVAGLAALVVWVIRASTQDLKALGSLKKPSTAIEAKRSTTSAVKLPVRVEPVQPQAVVYRNGNEDAVTIRLVPNASASRELLNARRIEGEGPMLALSPFLQAIPTLALADAANSSHLMEVVVRGDLVRAGDGNGWRAMVMGDGGIVEHAKLQDPASLQTLASGVAIWTALSVLTAQKHLLEIGRNLKALSDGLAEVQGFLQADREASIESNLSYIGDVVHAFERGEYLPRLRDQLESVDRDLRRVHVHLRKEIVTILSRQISQDVWGNDSEYASICRKVDDLNRCLAQMVYCARVRHACWYAASLYPDGFSVQTKRLQDLCRDLENDADIDQSIADTLVRDSEALNTFFGAAKGMERKRDIAESTNELLLGFSSTRSRLKEGLAKMERAFLTDAKENRLLLEIRRKQVVGVYLREATSNA